MKTKEIARDLVRDDLANSKPASNLAFNEEVKALIKSGRKISHFGFGLSPFPVPKCMVDCVKEFAHANEYLAIAGIPELREEIVKFHERYDNISLNVDNFVMGPGSKQLIYLVMTTFKGDIILPAPAWVTYAPQIRLAGKEPRIIQTDRESGWKLTPHSLEEAAVLCGSRWKLLIHTNPGNPSGTCYTHEELEALSAVCRRRSIIVLSDEIYARLTFSRDHASMVQHYPEGTILTTGFSKWASAGGWRLGYAHFPDRLQELFSAVKSASSHTHSCAPAPMQYGVAKALREFPHELDQYMNNCAKILQAVSNFCHRELSSVGVVSCKSEAGYYFITDFEVVRNGLLARKKKADGEVMSKSMLEEADVALMPAASFLRPADELISRFCFVCFDGAKGLEALESSSSSVVLDDDFVRQYCPPVVKGVENLKKWVKMNTE
ncbi:aspartate aminotransferase-like [Palaemon carinicauda]|uniref:aspartate aminotransferase-like n=1 Tax=Palaemon carinicauda TaxID=392227 RepID=UPI0035B5CF68